MRSVSVLKVTVNPVEDACVIRVIGELDSSTADRLRAPLEGARADGATTLVDLGGVSFVDSAGLRVLLEGARASKEQGWPLHIVRPSGAVLRLIELSGAARRLPLVPPQDGAPRHEPAAVGLPRAANGIGG